MNYGTLRDLLQGDGRSDRAGKPKPLLRGRAPEDKPQFSNGVTIRWGVGVSAVFFGGFKEFPEDDAIPSWIHTEESSSFIGSIGGVHLNDSLAQARKAMIRTGCRAGKVINPSKYGEPYDVLPGECGADRLIVGLENDRVSNLKIADRSVIVFPRH